MCTHATVPYSNIIDRKIMHYLRLGFLDKLSCLQFEVCASLSDRDYLRKVETEPTKVVVLDSEHKLWLWEPTKRGSFPSVLMGFAKHDGELAKLDAICRPHPF